MQRLAVCLRRKNALQGQLRTRLRIHPAAPPCTRRNAPAFCLSPRPCKRRRVSVFCMSLRTSAHTGAAIRVPAGMPGKLAAVWANSWRFSDLPKVLLFVLCCRKEYGLPRRCAPRNDMQRLAVCLRRKNVLQGQLRTRLRIHPAAPPCTRRNAPAFCLSPRPCKRRRVSVFCMSLRTSAHTGAAIRVPAEKLGKLVIFRANS